MATTSYYHGVRATQVQVTHEPFYECASGIPFVVGTSPMGKANYPVVVASYDDAIEQFGYSSDWTSYTLCEFIKSHFDNYGAQPAILVNVLDSDTMYTSVSSTSYDVTDDQVTLPVNTVESSIEVDGLTVDTDYVVSYEEDACILTLVESGSQTSLTVTYNLADASQVTKDEIIGGKDTTTRVVTGFEIIDYVYQITGTAPDILLAPTWSEDPEVALVMAAKAECINCVFRGLAIADIPVSSVSAYEDLEAYKEDNKLVDPNLVLCWPLVSYDDEIYHLSTVMAGTMAVTDLDEGSIPCASPSNHIATIDAIVTADGTELLLNPDEAKDINALGIVTAMKMPADRFVIWGPHTSGYPDYEDPQNSDIAANRMFDYICNNLVIKTWVKVDQRLNARLITGIVESMNNWLNGLTNAGRILGAEVKFLASENTAEQMNNGLIYFHVYLGTAPTARDIEYLVEQDLSYLEALIDELAS